jgi:hypothetical protein
MNEFTTDLLAYCLTRGGDAINHRPGRGAESTWANCAVGAFYEQRTGLRLQRYGTECSVPSEDFVAEAEDELPELVWDALNNYEPATYADLVDLIEQNEVIG